MRLKFYHSHREDWLKFRKNYIGGSDAGAIVGLNPYVSPYKLWAEKTGRLPEFDGNVTTRVGSYLEDLVAQMFSEETGKKVRRDTATITNDKYPHSCADVDRMIVGENAILEIKTTNSIPAMKKIKGGEFPEQWWCQVCHYMAVTECEKAYLAVLVNCREMKIYTLERDEAEIAALMEAENSFWETFVATDTPPTPDGSEATSDAITTIYADAADTDAIELFGHETEVEEYNALKKHKKKLETRLTEIENIIKEEMREAQQASCGRFSISWKQRDGNKKFSVQSLLGDYPDIDISKYYETGKPVRTFKISENKTEDK